MTGHSTPSASCQKIWGWEEGGYSRLEKGAARNPTKFIKGTCKVLPLESNDCVRALVQARGWQAVKQLHRQGPGGPAGQQGEHAEVHHQKTEEGGDLLSVPHWWGHIWSLGLSSTRKIGTHWSKSRAGPQGWFLKQCGIFHMRRGWEGWESSTWSREGSWGILRSHILEQVVQKVCGVFILGDIQHPDRRS